MEALVNQIAKLIARGQEEEARALIEPLKESDPGRYEIGQAALAVHRGDAATCRGHAQRARELSPDDPVPLQYLAAAAVMEGDRASAEHFARRAIERGGGVRSLMTLGSILLADGKPDEAAETFMKVTQIEPHNTEALCNLALSRFRLRAYGGAIAALAQAFEADPQSPRPIQALLDMLGEMGKLLGAMAMVRLLKDDESQEQVTVALDMAMLQLTRMLLKEFPSRHELVDADEAVGALLRSSGGRPPRVRLAVASALIEIDRIDEARSVLKGLESQPLAPADRGRLLYLFGIIAERERDDAAALVAYKGAIDMDGQRPEPYTNAISLLLAREDDEAMTEIAEILQRAPKELKDATPHLLFNEAIYLRRLGRRDEARANFERAEVMARDNRGLAELCRQAIEAL